MSIQKTAKNKADILFSKMIREHGQCMAQGYGPRDCTPRLEAAHWISRRYNHIRTDFDNAFSLCSSHHRWFTDHPTEWSRFAISLRGEDTYQRLLEASQKTTKFDWISELERLQYLNVVGLS